MMANEGEAVAREFAMFRAFEPQRARAGQGRVVTTVGTLSPEPRQQAARALQDELGYESWSLEGAGHFVAHDGPDILVAAVRRLLDELG
jgi:pimeloyl-ACP methyl ester carboxylesterase